MSIIPYVRQRWWLQCILMWLSIFVVLNISGVIGSHFYRLDYHMESHERDEYASLYTIPGIWRRWDAGYYLNIATEGYREHPDSAGFFPLYPLLIRTAYRGLNINAEIAGYIISNLSFLLSTLLFYKIARVIKDDHAFALKSVLAMLTFPTSLFYFALYAESLYLLLALGGVYLILAKQRFVGGGLLLGLSSIARPVGWLLDIVMIVEFFRRRKFDFKNFFFLVLGGILSVVGILMYIYYLYLALGTFNAIPNAQADWPRHWQIPLVTYWHGIKTLFIPSLINIDWFLYVMNTVDLAFTSVAGLVILLSFWWARKNEYPWSLSLYSAFALLFFLSSENEYPVPLWGMSRWVGSLFPLFFILGNMFKNKRIQFFYYLGSFLCLVFFTVWWTSGRWIG